MNRRTRYRLADLAGWLLVGFFLLTLPSIAAWQSNDVFAVNWSNAPIWSRFAFVVGAVFGAGAWLLDCIVKPNRKKGGE